LFRQGQEQIFLPAMSLEMAPIASTSPGFGRQALTHRPFLYIASRREYRDTDILISMQVFQSAIIPRFQA